MDDFQKISSILMVIFYKIYVSCLTHGSATSLLTTHSLHIFYIFSSISELNFIYKMCTWRVVPMCVAWSAYIKENMY